MTATASKKQTKAVTKVETKEPTTPEKLLEIAVAQNVDVDKLEKLMAMQERWEAKEAKKAYVAAKAKFLEECPEIPKTKQGHNSKYAPLDKIIQIIKPHLKNNDLSYNWFTSQQDGVIRVDCTLTHIMGHSESTWLPGIPDKSGNKNDIQAVGSTVKYLERYTLEALLGLSTGDEDDDGAGSQAAPETISDEQVQKLRDKIKEVGANEERFCKACKVESLDQLLANKFDGAMKRLESKANESK